MLRVVSPAAQRLFVRVVHSCRDGEDPSELIARTQHVTAEEKHIVEEESRDLMIFEEFQDQESSYIPSEELWAKMEAHLATNHLQLSVKNLHRAYQDVLRTEKKAKEVAAKPNYDTLSNKELTTTMRDVRGLVTQEVSSRRRPHAQGIR